MSAYLRQADSAWSHERLGLGSSTIGRSGCTLTCLTQAARLLGVSDNCTPSEVNKLLLGTGSGGKEHFVQSSLIVHAAAKAIGLESDVGKFVGSEQQLRSHILAALSANQLVLLCVDKTADKVGDHYILCTEKDTVDGDECLVCIDPAFGEEVLLRLRDLSGRVVWPSGPKTYTVVNARALWRKANNGNP